MTEPIEVGFGSGRVRVDVISDPAATVMRSFDRARKGLVRFTMDGQVFEATPEIPAAVLVDLVAIQASAATPDKQFDAILQALRSLLTHDSLVTFDMRLRDPANPITLPQLVALTEWLLGEVYGGRPTQPLPPLPALPIDGGSGLTDGAPPVVSTPPI